MARSKTKKKEKKIKGHRLIAYTKDIKILTGRSQRTSERLMVMMKEHYKKKPHQYISLEEMSEYLGLAFKKAIKQLDIK